MAGIVLQLLRWHGQPAEPAAAAALGPRGGSIGRAAHNDLVLPDPARSVSRVHARIRFENGRFTVEDCGAAPLRLNGRPVGIGRRVALAVGDVLTLGDYEVAVRDAASLPAQPPAPATAPATVPAARPHEPPPALPTPVTPRTLPDDWDPLGDLLGSPARPSTPPSPGLLDDLFGLEPAAPAPPPPARLPIPPPAPALPESWDPFADLDRVEAPAPPLAAPSLDELFGLGEPGGGGEDAFATLSAPPAAPEATAATEPVWFAVTAPPRLPSSRRFVAALAVHVESQRAAAERQLQRVGGPQAEPLLDLAPARQTGWRVGAPVSVRLDVRGGRAEPAEQAFEWNGRLHLAAFQVLADEAGADALELSFHVLLAGVPVGLVPLWVETGADRTPAPAPSRPAPQSAFASYASADADEVGLCLSTLAHWAPALAIFQDCLDLRPGEAFKPQLEQRIADSDAFLLFWSRRAAASPWVRWELDTARRGKGLHAVIPMPLEDPAIAPPPDELADRHWRDRFMVARHGLARIAEQAGR